MVALNHGATSPPAPAAAGTSAAADYAALGNTYLARARETGDPAFYSRAERAFDRRRCGSDPAERGRAGRRRHAGRTAATTSAKSSGSAARRAAPRRELARPLTVIADAQIELGRYRDAARTIQRLVDTKPGLPAYARVSYYRELHGDVIGALSRDAVCRLGRRQCRRAPRTSRRSLGDLELTRGRTAAARDAYRSALRDVPDFPQALTGLARIDAAGGALRRAAARLRRSTNRLPLTTALTLLAEVETRAGPPAGGRGRPGRRARAASAPAAEPNAAGRGGGAVRGEPRIAGAGGRARPARVAAGAEHPLRRRARVGADAGGACGRRGLSGRGGRCGRARSTRRSGCTPAWLRSARAGAVRRGGT